MRLVAERLGEEGWLGFWLGAEEDMGLGELLLLLRGWLREATLEVMFLREGDGEVDELVEGAVEVAESLPLTLSSERRLEMRLFSPGGGFSERGGVSGSLTTDNPL